MSRDGALRLLIAVALARLGGIGGLLHLCRSDSFEISQKFTYLPVVIIHSRTEGSKALHPSAA